MTKEQAREYATRIRLGEPLWFIDPTPQSVYDHDPVFVAFGALMAPTQIVGCSVGAFGENYSWTVVGEFPAPSTLITPTCRMEPADPVWTCPKVLWALDRLATG
jgi:hypothetical protein